MQPHDRWVCFHGDGTSILIQAVFLSGFESSGFTLAPKECDKFKLFMKSQNDGVVEGGAARVT